MDTQEKNITTIKTYDEICDMISFAKQCISQHLNIDDESIYTNINKVLQYINTDAVILTRQCMLMKKTEKISNIIFCIDKIDCIFINHAHNYIIYYSPDNTLPSLLIQRFISIHYPKTRFIIMTKNEDNNQLFQTSNWIALLLFVITTNKYKECESRELIDILVNQLNDIEFRIVFDDFCNIVVSNQSNVTRMDMTRASGVNTLTYKTSQNLNKILDIVYDIVRWSCQMIVTDHNKRTTQLYCKINNHISFEKIKKNINSSKKTIYETVIELWNRLNYELTLNVDDVQLIKTTFQNIIHCVNTHYKYLLYVLIDLLQLSDEDTIICDNSFVIMNLTKEYDEKIKNLTRLGDDMNSLVCDVIACCSK